MNIYKKKQFLNKFEISYDKFQIKRCPNNKVPNRCEYNEVEGLIKAYVYKEDCNVCRYNKKCIKYDFDERLNIIEIENKMSYNKNEFINKLKETEFKGIEIYKGYDMEIEKDYSKLTYVEILNEGINFRRTGKYERAKETYLIAIRMEPKKSIGYFNLGKILYILGDYESSVRSYQVAYELGDPQDIILSILEHMGHSLIDKDNKNGRYMDVVNDYSRGMKSAYKFVETASINIRNEYKEMCIGIAKKYLKEISK